MELKKKEGRASKEKANKDKTSAHNTNFPFRI